MKPFAHLTSTPDQQSFNYHLSRARIVVEIAFGRLKTRWRRLCKRNDVKIENIPFLHNMCEVHGDTFNDLWLEDIEMYPQPKPSPSGCSAVSSTATAIRDALVKY